jgi:hypothetical protein
MQRPAGVGRQRLRRCPAREIRSALVELHQGTLDRTVCFLLVRVGEACQRPRQYH